MALVTGSEGLLAVVTEVTVKLLPKPVKAQVMLAAFDSVAKAGEAVANIIASGFIPAGLEMMDKLATAAVEQFVHAGYPLDAEAILLCECDGTEEEVAAEIAQVGAVMRASGAVGIRLSRDDAERLKFWSGRKAAFPAVGRILPDYYCMDGTIPKKRLGEVLAGISRALERSSSSRVQTCSMPAMATCIRSSCSMRTSDGATARRVRRRILELCIEVGGTITGEHGVGIEKINEMCVQFRPAELAAFHAIKHAFDEHALLNPGKAVPTLHRCAEFGQMHVKRGQEKFPDLPRF